MRVKGRANDPLRHAAWWTIDQHSAVLVVSLATLAAVALVFFAVRKGLRSIWACAACGLFAGEFPATFYWVAAPGDAALPLAGLYLEGTFYGLLAGAALYVVLKAQPPRALTPDASGRMPGP